MMPITILTATYNHPQKLKELYQSLINQRDRNFLWVIVNDGSEEATRSLIESFQKKGIIDIVAYHQENGGKSKAINKGLDLIEDKTEFITIVDDDEKLFPDAIEIIKRYYLKYRNTNCGVIHFNRKDEKGNIIAKPCPDKDYFMSYQEHKAKGYHADGYLGYFTKSLGEERFRLFAGEKYIAPSTLFMKVTRKSKLLWAKAVLGETEYLDGGITKQGRRLRIKNPQGMIEYCRLMLELDANLKTQMAYSVLAYAYLSFVDSEYQNNIDTTPFLGYTKPFGFVLARKWKRKYLKE